MAVLATESKTVEEPLIKYAKQAGWEYISQNTALNLRRGETGRLFYSVLRESLIKLNSDFLNEKNIDGVVEKIDTVTDTIEGNKENLNWARGHGMFFDAKQKRNRNVTLIDFLNPKNNTFHVTQQWSYKNPHKKNRPDVMFLINGIPFAIVENKKPGVSYSMEKAIEQLKRLERETPGIMSYPQVFNITDALQYFYGATWNYSRKNIFNWKKEVQGKRTKNINLEESVLSFFEKKHFLKMIKDWILFYYKENELQKTILKQHQTRAVEKVIERCNEESKKRGLIWHTQGSGKTFTMLTAGRLILESNKKATVMIIVDRNELEGQLAVWVERIIKELKTGGILIEQANSKKVLQKLLKNDFRGLIISMLHKFKDIPSNICKRDDFYIFIDEAHRSIEGDLGNYLTSALPNATLIGFTGTPIDRTSKGRGTFKIFGKDDKPQGYLDKYSIAESIEDGTTVKIRHSLAPNKMTVEENLLETEFFQLAETEGISDIDSLNKVLKKSVKLRTFLKSSDRIDNVSKWIAKHFKENIQPLGYKAFVVAVDREACALYKSALDKHLPKEISKVVYTEGVNDSKLLKQYQLEKSKETTIRKNFVKANRDPQILIVTDKLLTGYDAPILYCMYLDKPMRDHVLLQAIARVNRPYEDKEGRKKPCGLIVDFVGVFKSLKKALSFDSDEVNAVIEDLDCLMQKFKSMMETDMKPYLSVTAKGADKLLEKLVYETLLDIKEREKFFDKFKEIETLYEILSPDPELGAYINDYKKMADLYRIVRNTYKEKTDFVFDVCKKTEKLIQESAELNAFSGITKTYEINEQTLKKIKEKQDIDSDNKKIINLIQSIQKEAMKNSKQEPYLISISERSKKIMEEFEKKQKNSKEALESIIQLMEEKVRIQKMRKQSTLSHQEFTIAWPLQKQGVNNFEILAIQISESFDKFKNFHNNSDEKRQLKMDIYKVIHGYISDNQLRNATEEIIKSVEETKK